MKNTLIQKETAYHEAGHAVIAFWLRVPFKYVSIIPDKETLGHLKKWPAPSWFRPDMDWSPRMRDKLDNYIQVSLAGHIAEKKLTKRSDNVGSANDMKNATDLALYIGGDGKGASLYLEWLWHSTENQVDLKWKNIEVLAKVLLEKKKISKKEVGMIIVENLKLKK